METLRKGKFMVLQKIRAMWIWVAVTVCLAVVPRFWAFTRSVPWISADSFTYLNLARVLRGERVPSGFDPMALAPRDDQGARTPGYPMFLNFAFTLSGWRGTNEEVLQRITKDRKPLPIELDPYHERYLKHRENLRAVQLLQHLCGVFATFLAFGILYHWTNSAPLASLGSLMAVGLRPTWILTYEHDIMTETLAATLVLAFFWFVAQAERRRNWLWLAVSSIVGSALALVRPNYAFAIPLFFVYWALRERRNLPVSLKFAIPILLPFCVLVGGWITRNGVKFGTWNLTTWVGVVSYHFQAHPEVFNDPILRQEINLQDYRAIAHSIGRLMSKWGVSFPEANRKLVVETKSAIVRYPDIFLRSVLESLKTHYGSFIRASPRWGKLRLVLFFALLAITVAGFISPFCKDAPPLTRFSFAFIVVNSLIAALFIDKYDQGRIAFPTESLLTLQAVWLAWKMWGMWRDRKVSTTLKAVTGDGTQR